tara:strand:+ start:598 stop:1845 length:1248 start_codon:yes stop_codon:yes gene_type:complete
MSKLGGNSPSADTDKSNNLIGPPGPAGADSTVPGPPGADSTVPGPPGQDGIVASVVGGNNITVDNTDPANPIINGDAGGASPTTTKGDLIARGASVDERLAVGTDGQALVADAASPSGLKWDTPAGGASSPLAVLETSIGAEAFSTSLFATKGSSYDCDADMVISHCTVRFAGSTTNTYKLVVAEVSGANDTIDVILGTTPITAATGLTGAMQHTFILPQAVNFVAGKAYSFMFVLTNQTTTTACDISFAGNPVGELGTLRYRAISRFASVDPQVGDDTGNGASSAVQMQLYYSLGGATLPAIASAIDIAGFINGLLNDSEVVLQHQVVRTFTLKAGLSASGAYARNAAAANATIDIQRNEVSIGSIDFTIGINAATFTFASDVAFAIGDRLAFVGQGTSDINLANVSLTISGEL